MVPISGTTPIHLILGQLENSGIKVEVLNFSMGDSPESRVRGGMPGVFAQHEGPKSWSRPEVAEIFTLPFQRGKLYTVPGTIPKLSPRSD